LHRPRLPARHRPPRRRGLPTPVLRGAPRRGRAPTASTREAARGARPGHRRRRRVGSLRRCRSGRPPGPPRAHRGAGGAARRRHPLLGGRGVGLDAITGGDPPPTGRAAPHDHGGPAWWDPLAHRPAHANPETGPLLGVVGVLVGSNVIANEVLPSWAYIPWN